MPDVKVDGIWRIPKKRFIEHLYANSNVNCEQ